VSENVTFSLAFITPVSSGDNLTLYAWVKDNSSNVSGYALDNITYYSE